VSATRRPPSFPRSSIQRLLASFGVSAPDDPPFYELACDGGARRSHVVGDGADAPSASPALRCRGPRRSLLSVGGRRDWAGSRRAT
jgi:hypothetical protein